MSWAGRTAVVIPAYGHYDYVRDTVRSLRLASPDAAVILVDDASPAGYTEYLPEFRAICGELGLARRLGANSGITAAWNTGFAMAVEAQAEHVCLANSDLLFSCGWLQPLVSTADLSGVGLVGPVTNAPGSGLQQQVSAWIPSYRVSDAPGDIDAVATQLCVSPAAPACCSVNGFCMLARVDRLVSHMFGSTLMNPTCRMVFSEYELQRRLVAAGLHSQVVPTSFVFHYRGVTRGVGRIRRNQQGVFRKCQPSAT